MNPRHLLALVLPLFAAASAAADSAAPLPAPAEVLDTLHRVNGYFFGENPDPALPIAPMAPGPQKKVPSNTWTRAVYFEGLMALAAVDHDSRDYDYAVRWGAGNGWGLYHKPDTRKADNQCCGQTYLELYAQDPKPERIQALQEAVDAMVKGSRTNDWSWCDALQMAMPVFARLGVLRHDPRYLEKMYADYMDSKTLQGGTGLYNPTQHLWWRDKNFLPPYHEPNGSNCYWARGNGWAITALARVLDILPADAPHREEYARTLQEMASALKAVQRPDGFWNVSLLDPNHFGGREVTGTALIIYGMACGIRQGLLPADQYEPVVIRAWNALAKDAVHSDGRLGYLQGTGKEPKDSQPVTYDSVPNYDDFGVGCFLLAGSEVWKMASAK